MTYRDINNLWKNVKDNYLIYIKQLNNLNLANFPMFQILSTFIHSIIFLRRELMLIYLWNFVEEETYKRKSM